MPKNPQELLDDKTKNPIYSQIMIRLVNEKLSGGKLAKLLKKNQSTVIKQLYTLENEGWIKKEAVKNRFEFVADENKLFSLFRDHYLKNIDSYRYERTLLYGEDNQLLKDIITRFFENFKINVKFSDDITLFKIFHDIYANHFVMDMQMIYRYNGISKMYQELYEKYGEEVQKFFDSEKENEYYIDSVETLLQLTNAQFCFEREHILHREVFNLNNHIFAQINCFKDKSLKIYKITLLDGKKNVEFISDSLEDIPDDWGLDIEISLLKLALNQS